MEDVKQRQVNEKKEKDKERDKAALVTALNELLLYTRRLMAQGYNEATIINGVVQATPNIISNVISPSLKIIPDLHKVKLLGQYINELRTEERLGDDPKLQSIVDQILAITPAKPPEPPKVVVRTSSPPATALRDLGMFPSSESGRKQLNPRGPEYALLGIFFGGLLTATAGMIVAAQAMSVGGLATSGFPPVAGVLFVIGGGLLLTSLALMAYYGYKNNKSMSESYAHVKLASSRG